MQQQMASLPISPPRSSAAPRSAPAPASPPPLLLLGFSVSPADSRGLMAFHHPHPQDTLQENLGRGFVQQRSLTWGHCWHLRGALSRDPSSGGAGSAMGGESPTQRGREAPGPVGREQILEGIAVWDKTGRSRESRGMAKEWEELLGTGETGGQEMGLLEDMAMYWAWLFWHWRCSCRHKGYWG